MADAKLAPQPASMDGRPRKSLHFQWRHRGAHLYDLAGGLLGDHVPSLLLTTTGRKSGEKFIFPLFYGEDGKSYIIVASKGGDRSTPTGIETSSPIRMSMSASERRRSRPKPGQQPGQSASGSGKRR